jgi:hypothetical protein
MSPENGVMVFIIIFVIPPQFRGIGNALTCTEAYRCDLCLNQTGCHYRFDFERIPACLKDC